MGEFDHWIDYFEQNQPVHESADAAIRFDSACRLTDRVRQPLVASLQRFQLGESGDGLQLLRKASPTGDPGYLRAAELFVAEEQQHASLLFDLLGYLDAQPMHSHWSDSVFVRLRRLLGLRTELMVLTVAEVIALSYYGALAAHGPDPVVRAVAARILADEHAHVRFHQQRLCADFADSGMPARLCVFALWWLTAVGTMLVVAVDHGSLLRTIGYRRICFARDVLTDFAKVAAGVLLKPSR
jgi:hypothetical protein